MYQTIEIFGKKDGEQIRGTGLYITVQGGKLKYFLAVDDKFIPVDGGQVQITDTETQTISLR